MRNLYVLISILLCVVSSVYVQAESLDFKKTIGISQPHHVAKKGNFIVTADNETLTTFTVDNEKLEQTEFKTDLPSYIEGLTFIDSMLFVATYDHVIKYSVDDENKLQEESRLSLESLDVAVFYGNYLYGYHNTNGTAFSLNLTEFENEVEIESLPTLGGSYSGFRSLIIDGGFVIYNNDFFFKMNIAEDGSLVRHELSKEQLGIATDDEIDAVYKYSNKLVIITNSSELISINRNLELSTLANHKNESEISIPYSSSVSNVFGRLMFQHSYGGASFSDVTLYGEAYALTTLDFQPCGANSSDVKRIMYIGEADDTLFVYGENCGLYLYDSDFKQIASLSSAEVLRTTVVDGVLYSVPIGGNVYKNAIENDSSELEKTSDATFYNVRSLIGTENGLVTIDGSYISYFSNNDSGLTLLNDYYSFHLDSSAFYTQFEERSIGVAVVYEENLLRVVNIKADLPNAPEVMTIDIPAISEFAIYGGVYQWSETVALIVGFQEIHFYDFEKNELLHSASTTKSIEGAVEGYLWVTENNNVVKYSVDDEYNLVNEGIVSIPTGWNLSNLRVHEGYISGSTEYCDTCLFKKNEDNAYDLIHKFGKHSYPYGVHVIEDYVYMNNLNGVVEVYRFNRDPKLKVSSSSVDEDSPLEIMVENEEGEDVFFEIVKDAENGTLSFEGKRVLYTPQLNYFGQDSFSYKLIDEAGNLTQGEFSIVVNPVNDAPLLEQTSWNLKEDEASELALNLTDVENDTITIKVLTQSEHGILTIVDSLNLVFEPNNNFSGSANVEIELTDNAGAREIHTLTFNIDSVDDLPQPQVTSFVSDEDLKLEANLNLVDEDGGTYTVEVGSQTQFGNVELKENGSFVYTPNPDFFGQDSFDVLIRNEDLQETHTIELSVENVQDAPSVLTDLINVVSGSQASGQLNQTDIDGDDLTYEIVTDSTSGSLTLSADGKYSYSPTAGYVGTDSFIIKVTDSAGFSSEQTINIQVSKKVETKTESSSGGGSFAFLIFVMLFVLQSRNKSLISFVK